MTRLALMLTLLGCVSCRYASPFLLVELVDIPPTTTTLTVDIGFAGRNASVTRTLDGPTPSSTSLSIELPSVSSPQTASLTFHALHAAMPLATTTSSLVVDGNGVFRLTVSLAPGDLGSPGWLPSGTGVPSTVRLFAIWGSSPTDLYVVGAAGTIYHSTDDAASWTQLASPAGTNDLFWIWGSGPSDVWAVGYGGVVLHRTSGAFEMMPKFGAAILDAVWGNGPNDVWIGGSDKTLVHSTGASFTATPVSWPASASPGAVTSIWGTGTTIYMTTDHGDVLRTLTGGAPLTSTPIGGALRSVWGANAADVWIVGDGTNLHHSLDANAAQTYAVVPTTRGGFYSNWGTSATDIYFVGQAGTLLHSTDDVSAVAEANPAMDASLDLNCVFGFDATHVYAVGGIAGKGIILRRSGP